MKYIKRLIFGLLLVAATGCTTLPPAWPGLAADGQAIYAALLDGKIHALNPENGNEIWAFPNEPARSSGLGCSGPARPDTGLFYANPVLTEDVVFVGSDAGKVYALDRANGNRQWEFVSQTETKSGLGALFAESKNVSIIGSPALNGEALYVPSADRSLYAVNAASGAKLWEFQASDAIWASPLVTEERIYVASMDHQLRCLDKETQTELWVFDAEGAIPSSLTLAGDTIYFSSLAQKVFAIDAKTGVERWVFDGMDSWAWARPLVISDTVYASAVEGRLFALDAKTGVEQWHFDAQGRIQATPAYADGTLYLPAEDMNLYALDAATGAQAWQFTASASLMTTPVMVDGTLYVVGMDNKVYALDAESGAQKWVYDPTPDK